jgi:hypothetical protein
VNRKDGDWRALPLALLGVLVIRLLAWGPDIDTTVHAGRLNQTIPTPTPQGQPVTTPSEPGRTPRPTEPQPAPTITLTATPAPSTPPDQKPPETASATVIAPATTPTAIPPTLTETPELPANTATQTPELPTSTPTTTAAEPRPRSSSTAMPSPLAGEGPTPEVLPPAASPLSGLWSPPCLSLLIGLVLIGAGAAVLVWHRRAG